MTNNTSKAERVVWYLDQTKEFWVAIVVVVATIVGLCVPDFKDTVLQIKTEIATIIVGLLGKSSVQSLAYAYKSSRS